MRAFRFVRPRSVAEAAGALAGSDGALLKAGGVDLLDRMKERVDEPTTVVGLIDVVGLDGIDLQDDGSFRIGAGATLAMLAQSPAIRAALPSLADAAGQAASPQLRHRATVGGNLAQRPRCGYYRHQSFPCLRRGGDHCPVLREGGVQETAGIFGNAVCASAHPSSLAPVLCSLDALLLLVGSRGPREVLLQDAWLDPAVGRAADLALAPDEVIDALEVPSRAEPQKLAYYEVRQRAAFDWALVSCAVRLGMDGDVVKDARIWLGAVAPTPWRAPLAEAVLLGKTLTDARLAEAGEAAMTGASPLPGNRYKLALTGVAVRRALAKAREESR